MVFTGKSEERLGSAPTKGTTGGNYVHAKYYDAFDAPKIVFPDIAPSHDSTFDSTGMMVEAMCVSSTV